MKERTRKRGVFAVLSATLLVMAVLITSCVEPINFGGLTSNEVEQVQWTPRAGMGFIQLNISTPVRDPRSVIPSTSGVTIDSYDVYIATASAYNVTGYTSGTPLTLPPGTHTVRVVGLESGVAKAAGEASVNITTGTGTTATVTPKEIVTEGTGTFTWALTNPDSVTTATMDIIGLSTNATNVMGTNVLSALSNPTGISLNSGYYRLEISLEKAGTKSVKVIEALHVYRNFVSHYAAALPVLKPNVYTVTFALNDGSGNDHSAPSVNHGAYVPRPTDPVHSTTPTWIFGGWYTNAGTTAGNEFGFNDSVTTGVFVSDAQIIGDLTVYAKWTDPATLTGSVTITINTTTFTPEKTPVLSPTSVSWDRITGTGTITISVTNDTDFASFQWYLDGASAGTGSSIVLNFTAVEYKIVGDWEVTLMATDAGGAPYSANVTITVNDA